MLDFEAELKKILNEDPLGILKVRVTEVVTIDQRLKDSFNEINNFIDNNGREPKESKDIFERKLSVRLNQLRKDFDKAKILKEFDKHSLLVDVKEVETIEEIFTNDYLGLLDDESEDIFNLKNIPKNRDKTDFTARRKPCKNFKDYEANFKKIQKEIKEGKRN